jgi:hypothetical protein
MAENLMTEAEITVSIISSLVIRAGLGFRASDLAFSQNQKAHEVTRDVTAWAC